MDTILPATVIVLGIKSNFFSSGLKLNAADYKVALERVAVKSLTEREQRLVDRTDKMLRRFIRRN